jgi:hypothetical protein
MLVRLFLLGFLSPVLGGGPPSEDRILRLAQSTEREGQLTISTEQQRANRELGIGRYYVAKHEYPAAINRFKAVIMQCPASPDVEEALARVTEVYLAIGLASEAQTAVAVLERKFPDGPWSTKARDALRSAGLEPAEKKSWIAHLCE